MKRGANPIHKVELESQILCAALRQSWAEHDAQSALISVRELSELFPDLLPPYQKQQKPPIDYYQLLNATPSKPLAGIMPSFMRQVRKSLIKCGGDLTQLDPESYMEILDAGFILRKARLRVSHDLLICRQWLVDQKSIAEDGNLQPIEQPKVAPVEEVADVEKLRDTITKPPFAAPPLLIQMLVSAGIIGQAEVAALAAQRSRAPEVPIERLILDSGYVVQAEMNSLKLAEDLILRGRITMAQFQVAMYDERNSGIRMAESLHLEAKTQRA